ncbi:MAG: hypothetical protein ACREMA_05290 [Longimicrobiales bacterium]
MTRASMPRTITMVAFAAQIVLLPWKQTRISNYFDGAGDVVTTTVYRPIFSPPRAVRHPEIAWVRLSYQLMITALLAWVFTRRVTGAGSPSHSPPFSGTDRERERERERERNEIARKR